MARLYNIEVESKADSSGAQSTKKDKRNITKSDLLLRYSSSKELNLIINPTEKCNFRCTYCPESFVLGNMQPEIVIGVKNLISNRGRDLDSLLISWFGGEPMLAYNTILDIMNHSGKVCKDNNIKLSSNITTNGYNLTSDKLKELTMVGVSDYQISFDGDKEEHNKLRLRIDGASTFEVIWNNLLNAHKSPLDFKITIRVHVNKNNVESVEKLIRRVEKELSLDPRFNIFIRPLSKLGSPNDPNLAIIEDESIISNLRTIASNSGLKTTSVTADYVCYASKLNSFVIRSDGSLNKCTVAMYDNANNIGKITKDGKLEINQEKILWWSRGLFSGDKKELACPMNG